MLGRTTATCTSAFLESFQKLADMALGTRGKLPALNDYHILLMLVVHNVRTSDVKNWNFRVHSGS